MFLAIPRDHKGTGEETSFSMKEKNTCERTFQPIFIHSSFRTGSTWLWSKFRNNPNCYCYYEIFNESLSTIDFKSIMQSPSDWNSHHPAGAPYFSEFSPLLQSGEGVAGFDADMAYTEFFLSSDDDEYRVARTKAYLVSLADLARSNGKIPVMSCTRSLARVKLIREALGGTQILLKRNLLNQWLSYSNQNFNGNGYFFNTIALSAGSEFSAPFTLMIHKFIRDNDIGFDSFGDNHDTLLIAFLALHIYLYIKHEGDFDVIVDLAKKKSADDMDTISRDICNRAALNIDLADHREAYSAPCMLVRDIGRVLTMVRSLFAKGIPGIDDAIVHQTVDRELADFHDALVHYEHVAGSAHGHIDIFAATIARQKADHQAMIHEHAALRQSADEQIAQLHEHLQDSEVALQQERADAQQAKRQAQLLEEELEQEQLQAKTVEVLQRDLARALEQNSILDIELHREVTDKAALQSRLTQIADDVSALRQQWLRTEAGLLEKLEQATLATEQERAKAAQAHAHCATLAADLRQAEASAAVASGKVEALERDATSLNLQLAETVQALQREKLEQEKASTHIEFVLPDRGQEGVRDDLKQRWDTMIKRLR